MKTPKQTLHPLNAGEAKSLKATIDRLNALSARQALLAIVNVLTINIRLPTKLFEEIIDDAWRLTQITDQKGK